MGTLIQEKRYQYWSKNGIVWTNWFKHRGLTTTWQLKPNLKNEYRTWNEYS